MRIYSEGMKNAKRHDVLGGILLKKKVATCVRAIFVLSSWCFLGEQDTC